jgi:heat shock protein HslJ
MTAMSPSIQGMWTDQRAETLLAVDGTRIAGTMGVNRFAGQLDDVSPFGALAMTRMAGPPELMLQEDLLIEHLQAADTVEVIDDGMFLLSDGLLLVELERSGTIEEPVTS